MLSPFLLYMTSYNLRTVFYRLRSSVFRVQPYVSAKGNAVAVFLAVLTLPLCRVALGSWLAVLLCLLCRVRLRSLDGLVGQPF